MTSQARTHTREKGKGPGPERPRNTGGDGRRGGTCVLAVLLGAGLGEHLEIDEAEGHEAQGEARHEARES